MSILIPGTSHQITWSVQNLTDETTYYVRAVIRDVRTETVLATINLDNLGNGRFSKYWNVPQDPTGFGRQIEIEKTIYEDAGYTTPSAVYGRWLDGYTIFNLATRNPSTGGYGPGSSVNPVDYREITNIFKRSLKEFLDTQEKPEPITPTDLTPVTKLLSTVLSGLSGLAKRISDLEVQYVSHSDRMDELHSNHSKSTEDTKISISDAISQIKGELSVQVADIMKRLNSLEEVEKHDFTEIQSKMSKEIDNIINKFAESIDNHGKKLQSHVTEAMTKPLRVSLEANVIPPKEKNARDLRAEKINKMLNV